MHKLYSRSTHYRLYNYAYAADKIKRLSKRTLTGVLGVSTLVFASVLLVLSNSGVQATGGPLLLGDLPTQKLLSKRLTDRSTLLVNAANGNVIHKTEDLMVRSVGPSLTVTRYLNNRASGSGQVGSHGTLSVGADVKIVANTNGSATYQGPSGFQVTYPSNGAGGYNYPAEYKEAKLVKITGGWRLTFNKSGDTYTFNSAGKQTRHADKDGLAIVYAYNADGTLATATDAQGKITTFNSYVGTKIGKITDPAGRTILYRYTGEQLTGVTDTTGKTWKFQYWDTRGNLNEMIDPRGYATTLAYNASNMIEKIRYNDYHTSVAEWRYVYHTNFTQIFDPLNHDTDYYYDGSGRITAVVNAVGDTVSTTWDVNNNQSAVKDPSAQITTMTYDALNNMTSRQNPAQANGAAGAKETYAYANTAHPYRASKKTDAAGNTTAYTYNTKGSVATSTSASSTGAGMGAFTYKYQGDPNGAGGTISCAAKAGQLCSSTDPRGNTTSYTYDTAGNVTAVTPPKPVNPTRYTYDSLSRIKTKTDGNNSTVTYTYDNADRPTLASYADGTSVTYAYDNNGNLLKRSASATNYTSWDYDGHNRISGQQQTGSANLNYSYDGADNIVTERGSAGTTTYSYDPANQLSNINLTNGSNQSYTYTHGRPTQITMPGGITQTMTYDTAGRRMSVKATKGATTLTHFSGNYTQATTNKDNAVLQSETDHVAGVTSTYAYDGLNRLVGVDGVGSNDYTYSYDNNGNRTQYSKNGAYSAIHGYNAANQLATEGGVRSGSYDLAGNQTSNGTGLSMTYNVKSQTTGFTMPGSATVSASYNDVGQTERTQIGPDTQLNGLLGVYSDTAGANVRTYTYGSTGGGNVVAEMVNGVAYYYLKDLRGSIVKVTDINGTVQNTYSYDPYGNTLTTTGSVQNPFRYAGGYFDYQTNLYKFGARYYSAREARWTQLDPSGAEYGYAYAGANPVNFVDPSGYFLSYAPYLISEAASEALTAYFGNCTANLIRVEAATILGAAALAPASAGASIGIGFASLIGFNAAQKEFC